MDDIKPKKQQKRVRKPVQAKTVIVKKTSSWFILAVVLISIFVGVLGGVLGDKVLIPYLATWPQFENNEFFQSGGTVVTVQKTEVTRVEENQVFTEAINKNKPAVVAISTETDFERIATGINLISSGYSGFILTADGLIVTTKEVIDDISDDYFVFLSDGQKFEVKNIISDPRFNFAFVKINADNLPVVELGASSEEKIGNYAAALGSSMILEQAEASIGAISSMDYSVQTPEKILTDQFQTDAKIVAKNSGGPVIGIDGKVIGMAYYLEGIEEDKSFVIPIDEIKSIYQQVLKSSELDIPDMGINYYEISPEFANLNGLTVKYGALVYEAEETDAVEDSSPAELAGIKAKDIIIKVNSIQIDKDNSFKEIVSNLVPGEDVQLVVLRDNQEKSFTLKIPKQKETE
jgi:S1-C subfamily serine protease